MVDLPNVCSRLDDAVSRSMQRDATPGLALALTDRDRLLDVRTYGVADLAAKTPITPETLFEIGSIAKSFLAIILLQLAEAGAVDLQAPVARYLPWFAVRTAHAPITLHHLLTHTAGIIAGTDFAPDARAEVWALRETETGGPPGERFHYSNVGYKALGLVVAAITGQPYPRVLRERILDPLVMRATEPAITHAVRPRLAVGYRQAADDLPRRQDRPLAPATWLETDTADGSIASTPADLAVYLRLLLNRGQGPNGRLLGAVGYDRLIQPAVATGPDAGYGYGIVAATVDGRPRIGHSGGMVGYYAQMVGDLDGGFGAVCFVNGPGRPEAIARHALDLLVASCQGRPWPDFVALDADPPSGELDQYTGTFHGEHGTITVAGDAGRLWLVTTTGEEIPLSPAGQDAFAVLHPDFARFLLRFGRDDAGVAEAWHGGDWYAADRYPGPTTFDVPPAWHAYLGHYRSHNPWATNFRVVLRKGALWLCQPGAAADGFGEEERLVPLGDPGAGRFRVGEDEASPERIRFDTLLDGEALRATLSGGDYYRFFTP